MSGTDLDLDALLEPLSRGDPHAAEQVYQAYAPFLRMVVRRQLTGPLRAKLDSMDVVQSVWADVWRGLRAAGWRFADRARLRAFLVRATRNRLIDRRRQHRRALESERPQGQGGDDPIEQARSDQPRPSELAQADELWETMERLCPPAHRAVLQLRRQGFLLGEIAERTGLHASSVRRIFYDLARRVAAARGEPPREPGAENRGSDHAHSTPR
jgi:RNA polymerase sigma-70 factor (ECF subfamily)